VNSVVDVRPLDRKTATDADAAAARCRGCITCCGFADDRSADCRLGIADEA